MAGKGLRPMLKLTARFTYVLVGLLLIGLAPGCATVQDVRRAKTEVMDAMRTQESNHDSAIAGVRQAVASNTAAIKGLGQTVGEHGTRIADLQNTTALLGKAADTAKAVAEDAMSRANRNGQTIDGLNERMTANAGAVGLLQKWAEGSDGQMTKVKNILRAHDTAITDTKTEVVKVKTTANAAVAKAMAARRSTGNLFVDSIMAKHGQGADKVFEFWGFTPGLADFDKVVKGKTAETTMASLKKYLEDGHVIAAVGVEDEDKCDEKKYPLCKDDGLAVARANAVNATMELNALTIAGWHRRSGDFPSKAEARRVLVFAKRGAAPTTTPATSPATTEKYGFEWSVSDKATAEELAQKLGTGYSVVEIAGTWFVQGGDYKTPADADAKLAEANKLAGIDGKVVKFN